MKTYLIFRFGILIKREVSVRLAFIGIDRKHWLNGMAEYN
jgi:hypothetical protein